MLSASRIATLFATICVCTASWAQVTPSPFNTAGPFVAYSISSGAYSGVFVPGSQWVNSNAGNATYAASIQGLGQIGVAKFGVSASGDLGTYQSGRRTYPSFAGGWSGWNDQLTFTSPLIATGGTGLVTLLLGYSWMAQLTGAAYGSAFVDINLIPVTGTGSLYASLEETISRSCVAASQCGAMSAYGQGGAVTPTWSDGVASFQLNVVIGRAYQLVVGMNALAYSRAVGDAITIDATHSLTWNGISSVTFGGAAVPYLVTSMSGANYALPVPELSTQALLLAGLGLIAGWLRKRMS